MTDRLEPGSKRPGPRQRLTAWIGAAALMVLPVLAIRAAEPGPLDVGDFMFLAILIAVLGAAIELAARMAHRSAYPAAICMAVVTALLQAWVNLAVGIIGSEDNPANLMYAGVIVVAVLGAALARFRASGMALAMVVAAGAQAAVFVAAIASGAGFTGPITIFFVTLWLLSAWLFREAARERDDAAGSQAAVGR